MATGPNWGGAREGAGRPRTRVTLMMPTEVIRQLEEVAAAEGAAVEDVVREAILSWLADWQARRDADN